MGALVFVVIFGMFFVYDFVRCELRMFLELFLIVEGPYFGLIVQNFVIFVVNWALPELCVVVLMLLLFTLNGILRLLPS